MKINRNMMAVTTNRHLLRTENKLSASMGRLSSGYKINRAGDNPAGLAISNKMKAQIDGLDQANSNASDGVSVLNIADGALNEVSSILQRIRELSVQAANGTNSYSDRKSMQEEIDKLTEEVDRISADTEYNTKVLLDGSSEVRVFSKSTERMYISDSVLPGDYQMEVTEPAKRAECVIPANTSAMGTITLNDVTMNADMSSDSFYENLRKTAEQAGCEATEVKDESGGISGYKIVSKEYGSQEGIKLEISKNMAETLGIDADPDMDAKLTDDKSSYKVMKNGEDVKVKLDSSTEFSSTATVSTEGNRVKVTDSGGFSMDFLLKDDVMIRDKDVKIHVTDIGAMSIQIGANQYQDMDVRIPEVSSESLYLDKVDVTVSGGPEKAMRTLDAAIAKLSSIRSGIGAYTNRLEYASNSLSETHEDMTSAYSGILDTDMAQEMTEYTQQNILEQASISVLSQANDLPQQVLSLLQ